jgi:hypothetical protein
MQQGDVVSVAGFDLMSTPPTGLLPESGDCSGYNTMIEDSVPGDTQRRIYKGAFYDYDSQSIPSHGSSNTGGSGSKVLNAQGQIGGAVVGGTGNYTDGVRTDIIADFTQPEFSGQLAPYAGT